MTTRIQIAALVFMMVNAVAFGIGIVPVLLIPALANHAFETVPAIVLASVLGIVFYGAVAIAERLAMGWHPSVRGARAE